MRHDALAVTDEIYEHIRYEGEHIPIATLPGMRERTVTISGASKTFSVTGWRVGWIVAPAGLTDAIRKVHDFLTVGRAGAAAGRRRGGDRRARAVVLRRAGGELPPEARPALRRPGRGGVPLPRPEGAYYILADFTGARPGTPPPRAWTTPGSRSGCHREVGVTPVPGSSFFRDGGGRTLVRFVFCKTDEILVEAAGRLRGMGSGVHHRRLERAAESGLQR